MKNTFLTLLLAGMLCVPVSLNAQVTIGGASPPQSGATLDLNADFTGGLLLPNVEITDLGRIPAGFTDVSVQNADVVPELAGLLVYNTNLNPAANIFQGIYYWDGDNWRLLALDGGMMHIDYDTSILLDCANAETGTVQISNPGLDIAGLYLFTVIAGNEFASVTPIDEEQGTFSVHFQPNPTANIRRAVVMVTDPAGRTAVFIFTQEGCPCTDDIAVSVGTHSGTWSLCQAGSVHAFVQNPIPGTAYFWVRNGIVAAEGAGVELRQIGTYRVYAGMIGCGTPAEFTITASGETAGRVPHIIVNNNGILCGSNGVTLSALNAPNPQGLIWLQNGLERARNTASFNVPAGAASEGVWYLIYVTPDGCSSTASNKINLVFTDGNSSLPPPDARINGVPINQNGIAVCAGGTLELTIANAAAYSGFSDVMFEWFGNGESLGRTTASTMFVVPPSFASLVISVTVTAVGECPMSVTSSEFKVIAGETPTPTSINAGAQRAYICAANPAMLTAGASGTQYQWFRNGIELTYDTQTIQVMQPGTYTVRYANTFGCWSTVSPPIEVVQSAPVTVSWLLPPASEEIFESSKTFSIAAAPEAASIEWSVVNSAHEPLVSIMPLGAGNAAVVTFGAGTEVVEGVVIKVSAANACGTAELLSDPFDVRRGCIPAGSLVITPNTSQTIEEGQSIVFTASANVGSEPITYTWLVDGIVRATGNTFTFTPAAPKAAPGYSVVVRVTNECTASPVYASPVPVIVTLNPKNLPQVSNPDVVQPHFHSQRTCLDVHQTGGAASDNPWADGGRLPLNMRPNDFNNGNTLTFTFPFSTIGGSNIRFMIDDPQSIVESVSGDANAAQAAASVAFNPNIIAMASGTTTNTALTFTLYAVFTVGNQDFQENITIRVQDQACGCPAQVGNGQWRMFECHNLGADRTIDPFTGTRDQLRGAYYQWGRKTPRFNPDRSPASPGSNPEALPDTWTTWFDPCPPGWRMAEVEIWQAVHNNNTRTTAGSITRYGDYLWLPRQGYFASGGAFLNNGGFHYWTRSASATAGLRLNLFSLETGASSNGGWVWGHIIGNYSENLRCVQAGNPH